MVGILNEEKKHYIVLYFKIFQRVIIKPVQCNMSIIEDKIINLMQDLKQPKSSERKEKSVMTRSGPTKFCNVWEYK